MMVEIIVYLLVEIINSTIDNRLLMLLLKKVDRILVCEF